METMTITGTGKVFDVSAETIDGLNMSDYDFDCHFYVNPKTRVILKKSEMVKQSDTTYRAAVDTSKLGAGDIWLEVHAQIPDASWASGFRTEIARISTGESTTR